MKKENGILMITIVLVLTIIAIFVFIHMNKHTDIDDVKHLGISHYQILL